MVSKYGVFCRVIELGSFTHAAEALGYSQSAVSQTIKALEQELGFRLIERQRGKLRLTADGRQLYPYLADIHAAELALERKKSELAGLENSIITIGAFTSITRTVLPPLMKRFQARHSSVTFHLRQGDYTDIQHWIQEGSVDFGFVDPNAVSGVETHTLYADELFAVLPPTHPLTAKLELTLEDLAQEAFILLSEGEYSVPMNAFSAAGVTPQLRYEVYDDYTILAMIRQGLGYSLLYRRVLEGFEAGLALRPLREHPKRVVALAWRNRETMPFAAKTFSDEILRWARKKM